MLCILLRLLDCVLLICRILNPMQFLHAPFLHVKLSGSLAVDTLLVSAPCAHREQQSMTLASGHMYAVDPKTPLNQPLVPNLELMINRLIDRAQDLVPSVLSASGQRLHSTLTAENSRYSLGRLRPGTVTGDNDQQICIHHRPSPAHPQ